mgnify:FL=1
MTIFTVTNSATKSKLIPSALVVALASTLLLSGCTKQTEDIVVADTQTETATESATPNAEQANVDRLLISYADMAHAAYKDSLDTAKLLQTAVNTFVDTPTEANLEAAKAARKNL